MTNYGYLYRGDPTRSPDHPDYVPGATNRAGGSAEAGKQRHKDRLAAFAAILKELAPHATPDTYPITAVIEAGRRVGVGDSTAREYAKELLREARP